MLVWMEKFQMVAKQECVASKQKVVRSPQNKCDSRMSQIILIDVYINKNLNLQSTYFISE